VDVWEVQWKGEEMTIEEALKLISARVETVWDKASGVHKKFYYPCENNPCGVWWNETQFINIAKAKKQKEARR